ncbi:MAG: AAA family ATPase, partial [Acidobacteriia bacterium]|nr:AAA family ATPase [Terriglobia bacterium]
MVRDGLTDQLEKRSGLGRQHCGNLRGVYGKTGTGKTIVSKYVLDRLEKKATELGAPVRIAYVNCRLAGTNYRVLAEICRAIGVEVPF